MTRKRWFAIIAGISVLVALFLGWRFIWIRDFRISATYDHVPSREITAYRNGDDIRVNLAGRRPGDYIIRLKDSTVGLPSNPFILDIGIFALAKQHPVAIVDIRSAKIDNKDPQLFVSDRRISFLDIPGKTIVLTW